MVAKISGGLKHDTNAGAAKSSTSLPQPNVNVEYAPSSSDPVLLSYHDSRFPTAVGAIKREVGSQRTAAEPIASIPAERGVSIHVFTNEIEVAVGPTGDYGENQMNSELSDTRSEAGLIPVDGSSHPVASNVSAVDEATLKLEKLKFSDGQCVIIQSHIQVPDSIKIILSFGSLDVNFGAGKNYLNNSESNKSSNHAAYSVDEDAEEISSLESNISDAALKDEKLPAVGPLYLLQTNPSYSLGFMPPIAGSPFAQLEGHDTRARLSNPMVCLGGQCGQMADLPIVMVFLEHLLIFPSVPGLVLDAAFEQHGVDVHVYYGEFLNDSYAYIANTGCHTNSGRAELYSRAFSSFTAALSSPLFSLQSYFNPFFVLPTLHQFFGHSGYPPQMQTGHVSLPPPGTAAGMKISPAPYKQGTNTRTHAHAGMPSGYGVYGSFHIGYSPNAAVISGNQNTPEDLVQSALKESNIYPGQQVTGVSASFEDSSKHQAIGELPAAKIS
ncbi:hypothetical protein Ancab_004539 [Ancistrocladus abbreviatus]